MEKKNVNELQALLDELLVMGKEELDEVEMLCGCTGHRCESGMISIG